MPHPRFAPFQPTRSQQDRRTFAAFPDEVHFLTADVAKENGSHIRVSKIRHNRLGLTVRGAVGRRACARSINKLLGALRTALAARSNIGEVR